MRVAITQRAIDEIYARGGSMTQYKREHQLSPFEIALTNFCLDHGWVYEIDGGLVKFYWYGGDGEEKQVHVATVKDIEEQLLQK